MKENTEGNALAKIKHVEGHIVLDDLDTLLPVGADTEIAAYVADAIRARIAHSAALFERGAELMIEAGAYLCAAKKRFGRKHMPAIYEAIGISERTAYNYMGLYNFRDKKFVRGLDPGKAFQTIRLLNEPGVRIEGDNLIIEDGDDTVTVTMVEAQGMTMAQMTALARAVKAKDKKLRAADVYAEKLEKNVKDGNEKIAQLQKQINEILCKAEKDPLDKKIEDAQKALNTFGRLWTEILDIDETDLTDHQRASVTAIREYQITLATSDEV